MPGEVVAQLSPDQIHIEPGGRPVDVTLTIQNRSDNVAEYLVEITGLDSDWFTPPPSRARLFPQDRDQLRFVLRPPGRAGRGTYAYRVVVRSLNGVTQATADGTIEVTGTVAYRLELPQRRLRARGVGTFQVQLVNTGSADVRLALEAKDVEGECELRFARDATLRVPVGETAKVPLRVRPFKRSLVGRERSYDFSVVARPDDAGVAPQNVSGQFTYRPWIETWSPVRNVVIFVGVVCVAVAIVAAVLPVGVQGPLGGLRSLVCDVPIIGSLCGRPAPVAACAYDEGFKAYAQAESKLIGECVTPPLSDVYGNVKQYTRNGVLFWQNSANTVYFFKGDSLYGFIGEKSALIHGTGAT